MKKFRSIMALSLVIMLCLLPACGSKSSVNKSDKQTNSKDTAKVHKSVTDELDKKNKTDSDTSSETEAAKSDTAAAPSPSETQASAHNHSFIGANCTTGGKCACGVNGAALGHSFTSAGCTAPATCTRCGITNGSMLGHSYTGGRCTRCGDTNGPLKPGEAALFRNKLTDEENAQALAIARSIVAQINSQLPSGSDLERVGMAAQLVSQEYRKGTHVEKGNYYHTAYGVFVKRESSCAGCSRALGLVLSCMGYNWNHVNENQWKHQWVTLTMDGEVGWADGQIGLAGIGSHPYVQQ